MSEVLDRALEQSLEMLRQGRSVEDCLDRFPQEAAELRPILMAFAPVRDALAAPMPPLARARVRSTVMEAWDRRAASPARWWRLPWNVSRFAMSAGAAVIVLAFVGGTATYASGTALPGDLLYPVKQTREDVQLALARSPEAKVEVLDRLLDERADEVRALARAGRVGGMAIAAERMQRQAQKLASLAEDVGAASTPTPTPGGVSPDGAAVPTPGLTPTPVSLSRTKNEEDQPVRDRVERVLAAHAAKAEALADEVAPETLNGDQEEPKKAVGRALDSVSKTLKPTRGEANPGRSGNADKATPADDRGQGGKSGEDERTNGVSKDEPARGPDGVAATPDGRKKDEGRDTRAGEGRGGPDGDRGKPDDTPNVPGGSNGLPVQGLPTPPTPGGLLLTPTVVPPSPTPIADATPTPEQGPELPVQVTPAATPSIDGGRPLTPLPSPDPTDAPVPEEEEGPGDEGRPPWDPLGTPLPWLDDPRLTPTLDGEGGDRGPRSSGDQGDGKSQNTPGGLGPIAHGRPIATPAPIGEGYDDLPPLPTLSSTDEAPAGSK